MQKRAWNTYLFITIDNSDTDEWFPSTWIKIRVLFHLIYGKILLVLRWPDSLADAREK